MTDSDPKHTETPPPDPLDVLVVQCLERMERDGSSVLDELCAAHPEHAQALRKRVQALGGIGFLQEPDEDSVSIPERLGEFRLQERLGQGGMGVVYLAEQESLGRSVALKIHSPTWRTASIAWTVS